MVRGLVLAGVAVTAFALLTPAAQATQAQAAPTGGTSALGDFTPPPSPNLGPDAFAARHDLPVSSMTAGRRPLPLSAATQRAASKDNYGVSSSLQSFLNANGVDALGAYDTLTSRYHQLPGTGEIVTNVSVGDLTDAGMTDQYVKDNGPTTILKDGKRYLDIPSMPLIPTYTASADGKLDAAGSIENQDPSLGEVLLDFAVMAPLPHASQRPGAVGSGATDLQGIAPGAQYRLVVPQTPDDTGIAAALLAAAKQTPRPDVITASLGTGTDQVGFPGRYLEDTAAERAAIATIVRDYHVVVCLSSNDGTRLFTPTAVGPDGGSTPTDLAPDEKSATDTADDEFSTTPSLVPDTGAIAVGGTTLDDTLAVPGGANGTFAATRTDGPGTYSSGFGSRLNVSAPGDGIPAFEHPRGGTAQAVTPVLEGGTSASAPETAAAAAVVLQTAKLTGRSLSPADVRDLIAKTGRPVATPPQIDRPLDVGNQLDLSAAVNSLLPPQAPKIQRLSVAHRVTTGSLGGDFTEATDPNRIDLQTGTTGEGLVGPVTIGADITGSVPGHRLDYVLSVGNKQFHADHPAVRVTPAQLLQAAGLPVVAKKDRSVNLTFQVKDGTKVLASASRKLAIGPTDGTYAEAQAPIVPPVVAAGSAVKAHYDLTGVRVAQNAELVVSTVGHWNPALGPIFSAAFTANLTAPSGDVTIPASVFGSGGLYGVGIIQAGGSIKPVYGEFASLRVDGDTAAHRPPAPTLSGAHQLELSRVQPQFSVGYDVRGVPGAAGAALELSAPAPTLFHSLNTVTNANGTQRDQDGVNSPASAFVPLPGTNGAAPLDATKLGVTFTDAYSARVFALDAAGKPLGQASPTSLLQLDDGSAPENTTVAGFSVGGSDAFAVTWDGPGTQSLRRYSPATGTYGAVLATDSASSFAIVGVDQNRLVVLHGRAVELYDTASGKLAQTVPTGDYGMIGSRIDHVRHRALLLAHHAVDNADQVFTLDLATGVLGQPITADDGVAAGSYRLIDVDESTGLVYLSKQGGGGALCFSLGTGFLAKVDVDARVVTKASQADGCTSSIAADHGTVYELSYRAVSVNLNGTSNLIPVPGDTLNAGQSIPVRTQPSLTLAIDTVHHLALVAFATPPVVAQYGVPGGLMYDSNATGQLATVDLTTGKTASIVRGFDFASGMVGPGASQSVQLDPATRTGWTFTPDGRGIQQFPY